MYKYDSRIFVFQLKRRMAQSLDQFGISMIYPTKTGGRVWTSKWSQQVTTKTYRSVCTDDIDPEVQYRGDGYYTIYGQNDTGNGSYPTGYENSRLGLMEMPGPVSRYYVRSNNLTGYNKELGLQKMRQQFILIW